jgi:TolB-like protein
MNAAALFAELKRRNVHRAAVFYAGAAWLLVQVATQVFPFFDIPNAAVRAVIVAALIGFVPAMLLSWIYEWTPSGIRRESAIEPGQSVTAHTGKMMDRWIIAVLGLAVMLLLANTFWQRGSAPSSAVAKSIAVLPLLNESGDPANEYFSDGLSEELIAALAQINELKVIGRSSSFRFKGSSEDSRSIGEKLGVGSLLEGTVRRQGDSVRIVAELINVADGRELWSQTFDRELKDVFKLQAEIAQAVASSLKLNLLGSAMQIQQSAATENVAAHNAYLQAHFYFQRRNQEGYQKAIGYLDEAIRLDPGYALAYAERAEAWTWMGDLAAEPVTPQAAHDMARRDALKAVATNPDLAEAHAALGWVLFFVDWKFDEGLAELRRGLQLAPSNATVADLLARVLVYMGQFDEASALAKQAVDADPLTFWPRNNLARIEFARGQLAEADADARKAAELQPNAASSHRWQVLVAMMRGDGETALREAQLEPTLGYRLFELAIAQYARHDRAAADAALADLVAAGDGLWYQVAQVYAVRGENDAAFDWLQRAYDGRDTGMLGLAIDPLLRGLRSDPRFDAMIHKIGLPSPN